MKKNTGLLHLVFLLLIISAHAQNTLNTAPDQRFKKSSSSFAEVPAMGNIPLYFIENIGQVTDQYHNPRTDIQFRIPATSGLNIFIGNGEIHYQFTKTNNTQTAITRFPITDSGRTNCIMYRMDVSLIGANKNARVISSEKEDYYENHITPLTGVYGARAAAWSKITYKDIYPNIDWVLFINNGQLEHEFIVNEGGDVANIQLKYGGASELKLNAEGNLAATTPQGTITEKAPISYQQDGKIVKSSFKLIGDVLSFNTGNYKGAMIIDPSIEWATYLGGNLGGNIRGIATSKSGNVHAVGITTSTSGIATVGAYQDTLAGGSDVFIQKFNSAGVNQWATYFGKSSAPEGAGIVTDTAGNIYVVGATTSTSGIATPGAYQTVFAGGMYHGDAFLAKFNAAGALQWATYFGGSGEEDGQAIAIDKFSNLYITGITQSLSGIATTGAYQTSLADTTSIISGDAYLAKFNSSGAIQWATYYGGNAEDDAYGAAVDTFDNIYLTGNTWSSSRVATPGAYQTGFSGGATLGDAFLAKFNSAGALQWGTYYGGSGDEFGRAVTTDPKGNIYITGYTESTTGIATAGAHMLTFSGSTDCYLAKFNSAGAIQWGTYYGGNNGDAGFAIASDDSANVYLTGYTSSPSGIATPGGYLTTLPSIYGAGYLSKFNTSGVLQWGSYYAGGSSASQGQALAMYHFNTIYLAGITSQTSGIATPGAYQTTYSGTYDGFLTKFNLCTAITAIISGKDTVCTDTFIVLTDSITGGTWSSSDTTKATVTSGIVRGKTAGIDTIKYTSPGDCSFTVEKVIYVSGKCKTGINSITHAANDIFVFPNPTSGKIIITNAFESKVQLLNMIGVKVFSGNITNNRQDIDISNLVRGAYLVLLTDVDGNCTNRIIVKE